MTEFSRRRLLTAMALSPLLLSPHLRAATATPDISRIVALEWLPVELLLALGVTPWGVAETHTYRQWVREPALPAGVIDVGLRMEPNLELLTQMQPSLLLYSNGYGPSQTRLARIAPGMGFDFNDGSGKPLTTARHSLIALGERLGLQAQAHDHLAHVDKVMAETRQRLARFADRPILLMSLMDNRHTLVFGKLGLFAETMAVLGLKNAWQGETNFWGSAVIGIENLASVRDTHVICFDHDNQSMLDEVTRSALWQSLPFVRSNDFVTAPAVWFYGATLSAINFCQVLVRALEGK